MNDRPPDGLGRRRRLLVLAVCSLSLLIVGLDTTIVNVALPAITAYFKLQLGDVQWLVICYVLVYGSLMLVCGKLGDLFGHRLIFRLGLAVSAVGCAACHGIGYRGRVGVHQVMPVSDAMRELIVASAGSHELARLARTEQISTLRDAALARVRDGTTSLSEALAATEVA